MDCLVIFFYLLSVTAG